MAGVGCPPHSRSASVFGGCVRTSRAPLDIASAFALLAFFAPLVGALQGFGIVLSAEPLRGSVAGGTQLHIIGSGFADAVAVLIGGKPCSIFFPGVKDGELMCFTPPNPHGMYDVEVLFTSGHRAKLRNDRFFCDQNQNTPWISQVTGSVQVNGNVTFWGNLKKVLEGDQRFFQGATGEIRNATEVMHAYLGTGQELLGALGGLNEYRCDLVETPDMGTGICTVSARTPAGYYNLSYVLEANQGCTKCNTRPQDENGYGTAQMRFWGRRPVSFAGQEYDVEVFPSMYSVGQNRTGRMGGASIVIEADGLDPVKGHFAERHSALLDGVPCEVQDVVSYGNKQRITCIAGAVGSRTVNWPNASNQPPPGEPARIYEDAQRTTVLKERIWWPSSHQPSRNYSVMAGVQLVAPQAWCATEDWLASTTSLEECAEWCYQLGNCSYFFIRPEFQECRWCEGIDRGLNVATEILPESTTPTRRRRWGQAWSNNTPGGVYKLAMSSQKYQVAHPVGPTWRLMNETTRCKSAGISWMNWNNNGNVGLLGADLQTCADLCSMNRVDSDGGDCKYWGLFREHSTYSANRCVLYVPDTEQLKKQTDLPRCGTDEQTQFQDDTFTPTRRRNMAKFSLYELTKPTPHMPQPSGMYPGSRGVLYRVWDACPKGNTFNNGCNDLWNAPFAPLFASVNPDYKAQRPLFEGIRTDMLRGPFGFEPPEADSNWEAGSVLAWNNDVPFASLQDASGDHGMVFEVMGYFVAPFTANYSFLVWGTHPSDLWVSQSADPTDMVKAAEKVDEVNCGTSRTMFGCAVFGKGERWRATNVRIKHSGRDLADVYGEKIDSMEVRTPTLRQVRMRAGERRFLVKRTAFDEDTFNMYSRRRTGSSRRRRNFMDGSAVRIHAPDLSSLSPTAREVLANKRSWPEILHVRKEYKGDSGEQWRFGIKEVAGGDVTWSRWIRTNFFEWDLITAWNEMVLPSGVRCSAEVWYLERSPTANSWTNYSLIVWQPAGKLQPLQIERSAGFRTRVDINTISSGNKQDLFITPIGASMLEVPEMSGQVQMSAVGVSAARALDFAAGNGTGDIDDPPPDPPASNRRLAAQTKLSPCTDAATTPTAYRYYRLVVTQTRNPQSYTPGMARIKELVFWRSSNGAVMDLKSAVVTANVSVLGTNPLTNLVDGDRTTHVALSGTTPEAAAITIDLGSAVAVDMWHLENPTDGNYWYSVEGWSFLASNDQTTWVPMASLLTNVTSHFWGSDGNIANQRPASCGLDLSGCEFGHTFRGQLTRQVGRGWGEKYASWGDCQRRCCYDYQCQAAVYNETSQMCEMYYTPVAHMFRSLVSTTGVDTVLMANVVSRGPPQDNYNYTMVPVDAEGLPIKSFTGHRSVQFCKDQCDNDSRCRSFSWHTESGCALMTQCVRFGERLSSNWENGQHVTFYQKTPAGNCSEPGDFAVARTGTCHDVVNPPESARKYSSVYGNTPPGVGQAKSMLYNPEAWTAGRSEAGEWMQVDLRERREIPGIIVQGRPDQNNWVTRFTVQYSQNGQNWENLVGENESGASQSDGIVFDGARDRETPVQVRFPVPIEARFLRIVVVSFVGTPAMRMGVVSCLPADRVWDAGAACSSIRSVLHDDAGSGERLLLINFADRLRDYWTASTTVVANPESLMTRRLEEDMPDFVPRRLSSSGGDNSSNATGTTTTLTSTTTTTTTKTWTGTTTTILGLQTVTPKAGFLRNKMSGKCLDVSGKDLKLNSCEYELPSNATEQRWVMSSKGFLINEANGLCVDGNTDTKLTMEHCITDILNESHPGQRWLLNPEGYVRSQRSGLCVDPSGTDTGSSVRPSMCDFGVPGSDETWEFVEPAAPTRVSGFLRMLHSNWCLDIQGSPGFFGMRARVQACQYMFEADRTDHIWQLRASGTLYNPAMSGCAAAEVSGTNIFLQVRPCTYSTVLTFSYTSDFQLTTTVNGAARCLDVDVRRSTFANVAEWDQFYMLPCNASDSTQKFEFVDAAAAAGMCCDLCGPVLQTGGVWQLDRSLNCKCKDFPGDGPVEFIGVGNGGAMRAEYNAMIGFIAYDNPFGSVVTAPWRWRFAETTPSALSFAYRPGPPPGQGGNVSNATTNRFGFTYLSQEEQPQVNAVTVNGAAMNASALAFAQGDQVVLTGANFGDIQDQDLQIMIGEQRATGYTVTATTISFVAPPATHARVNLRVLVGWKGFADFGPYVMPGAGRGAAQVAIVFGGGANVVQSSTPDAGSILGGARLTIVGRGFRTPSDLNQVILRFTSGTKMGMQVGLCEMRAGNLTQLECQAPALDRSHWTGTQVEESVAVEVNGVRQTQSGAMLTFTYSRAQTPQVLRVVPSRLSYAQTANITLIGYKFGLIKSRLKVSFGERPCKVWDANQTVITCQLLRTAMAQPPLCSQVRDVYNASCVVKPFNYSVQPSVLVSSAGYALAEAESTLDSRFELHNVTPSAGSELGGAIVTLRGVGFSNPTVTQQLMVAALGTFGDWTKWTDTEVVFVTRPVTLNEDKIDLMVNLISVEHRCGPMQSKAPCYYRALGAGKTPKVKSFSRTSGVAGDTISIVVQLPPGEGANVGTGAGSVTVNLGEHVCPSTWSRAVDRITISCTLPQIEGSSSLPVKVQVLPLGYSDFDNEDWSSFTTLLRIDSADPASGSLGGGLVTFKGAGFATDDPKRHWVRVGTRDDGICTPIASTYNNLTCLMNYRYNDQDGRGGTVDEVEITLWDVPVAQDPMLAFGDSFTGCLRYSDNWRDLNVLSFGDCAMRCLVRGDCKSFDYIPRNTDCRMSTSTFRNGGYDGQMPDCRYYAIRSDADPSVAIKAKFSWTFSVELTPNIQSLWLRTNTGSVSRGTDVKTTQVGCGATNADLWTGNNNCCSGKKCSLGEGRCASKSECAGNLDCVSYACPWSYTNGSNNLQYGDQCCVLRQGEGTSGFFENGSPYWRAGDEVVLRINRLSTVDVANNHRADPNVVEARAHPGNGYLDVTFDGVKCIVTALELRTNDNTNNDLVCTLGEVPGGLVHMPELWVTGMGRAMEPDVWLVAPLTVSSATIVGTTSSLSISAASLGGGWQVRITGSGFAPPPNAGARSFVEVAICGKRCEVVSGTYTQVVCQAPNVTTPGLLSDPTLSSTLPKAQVLSQGAGTAGVLSPTCFQGSNEDMMQYGHSSCVAIFDGDSEVSSGLAGGSCNVGLDFGSGTNARIEEIRYHPHYDVLQANGYVNSRFEVGVLSATQPCDELSYGWRGTNYLGCQSTTVTGQKCASWDGYPDLVAAFPELAGHNKCRNPRPGWQTSIWCWTETGNAEKCNPKPPAITWTTVHTIVKKPMMLWNSVMLMMPREARYFRYISPPGQCMFTEIEVVGQLIAPASSCGIRVRNVRRDVGPGAPLSLNLPMWQSGNHPYAIDEAFGELASTWASSPNAVVTFEPSVTPTIDTMEPTNGTARGGTLVTLTGANLGSAWVEGNTAVAPVTVKFNGYTCRVTKVTATSVQCVTSPRNAGIRLPSVEIGIKDLGRARVKPGLRWRYLDRWSSLDTWANQEPPVDGDYVSVPKGQALMLDMDTPVLLMITVEGVLVWDDTRDLHMQATYIWVKGGTFEIGTEDKPFMHRALITLHGNKYEAVRLPVLGAKVLGVSNTQFTIREFGDHAQAAAEDIGTLDIHGAPRLKVWTRIARTAEAGSTVVVLQEQVDWKPGEELMIAATTRSEKHVKGNGLFGSPPVDFQNERVFVRSISVDRLTITLTAPLRHTHISTSYTRPDGEFVDLSAEIALLSRNVRVQGDPTSEIDSWGCHTLVAFGGIYRIENAEFFRCGQTGELSRYPIHFHISQHFGSQCYAKYNSIHHSFQRAVTIHATEYVHVKGNVGFDIVGHMFFIETGMERYNILEGNLGVGAIPLLSGMVESDQEPSAFWTAAPNNVWIDNVAVTGSDGWYFQLSDHPVSHNMDTYADSVCPIGDRLGEWSRNRCHHTTGSCIRVYLKWTPTKDPCNHLSGEAPQILFNTTCWGVGKHCFTAMKMGSLHNHHMTSIETGGSDYFAVKFNRGESHAGGFWSTDYLGIPHIKDSVFVGILPENLDKVPDQRWKTSAVEMAQDEQFIVDGAHFVNFRRTPAFSDCTMCWTPVKFRQGANTYRFSNVGFTNSSKRIFVLKKGIYWDVDGTLTGTKNSYTTWADKHMLDAPTCATTQGIANVPITDEWNPTGGLDDAGFVGNPDMGNSIFHVHPALIHSRRDFSFVTCTSPIRKMTVAYPEPAEVTLRQLNITNLDTGKTHVYEYEEKEVFGWGFPVVAGSRLEIRPNFPGLDLTEASVNYGFSDLFAWKDAFAMSSRTDVTPEWLQLTVASWSKFDHYRATNPDWEMVAVRRGEPAGVAAQETAKLKEPLTEATPMDTPENLPSMSHTMIDDEHWAVVFRHPLPDDARPITEEPLSVRFEARRCPDEGCTQGLGAINYNWTNPLLWSEVFGATQLEVDDNYVAPSRRLSEVTGAVLEIKAEDWVVYDLDAPLNLKSLTIFGKLSFDDSADRVLRSGDITVWGLLEVGTPDAPFGAVTGATARIVLRGSVYDTESYVYVEEETLHNKVIAVPGRVETYGVPMEETWLRLAMTAEAGSTYVCVLNGTEQWPVGSIIAIAPTEFDNPSGHVETREVNATAFDANNGCLQLWFATPLLEKHYSGQFSVSQNATIELRSVVGRLDRSVIFESEDVEGNRYYGGHFEVFDVTTITPARVGSLKLRYTQLDSLGKDGLSAAVKIGYRSNFVPPPTNVFAGCSWVTSMEYALHVQGSNANVFIKDNVMTQVRNAGIFIDTGSLAVQIVRNAVIGVSKSFNAPVSVNEFSGNSRVPQFAGIRTDVLPVRMVGNVVAGSDDMAFMHPAEPFPPMRIFDNEAFASIIGVFVLPLKDGTCQTVNSYKVWKMAHIGVFLADVVVPQTRIAHIVVSDCHLGIVPYMSVGSAYRRLFVKDTTIVGTSPAGESCTRSRWCRTQSTTDNDKVNCRSIFAPSYLRRVGFVAPFNTLHKKTCWMVGDPRQCRVLSQAFPKLDDCDFPFEKHIHMDKGLGWTFFERTTFARFKESDCTAYDGSRMRSRAYTMSTSGPEVSYPSTFRQTTWHMAEYSARFDLSAASLDSSFTDRRSPCRFGSGGCMGLDQALIQDMDGSFIEAMKDPSTPGKYIRVPEGTVSSVVPNTPRTDLVWSPMCSTSLNGTTVGAQVCVGTSVQLLEMKNIDRGAKDIKFGPLVLTPDAQEDNGFDGGVLSSVGPFYASCPCGWDFSFYHVLIKPNTTYDAEVISLPENFVLRYWSPNPGDSVVLKFYYPDSRGVNVFIGESSEQDLTLKLTRMPTKDDPHGSHVVDSQGLTLAVTLRGSPEGFDAQRDVTIRRSPTVVLKMNVQISMQEFNGPSFQTNLAILLGIPPERVKVVAVAVRRLEAVDDDDDDGTECIGRRCEFARRLAATGGVALDITIEPSAEAAATASAGNTASTGTSALNAQNAELSQVSSTLDVLKDSTDLAAAAGGEVYVTQLSAPAGADSTLKEGAPSAATTQVAADVDIVSLAAAVGSAEVSAEAPCLAAIGVSVTVGGLAYTAHPTTQLATGATENVACSAANSGYQGNIVLSCNAGTLSANKAACVPKGCSSAISVTLSGSTVSVAPPSTMLSGTTQQMPCSGVNAAYGGTYLFTCASGVLTAKTTTCQPGCAVSDSVTVVLAGSSKNWSPSSAMVSGAAATLQCGDINSGYTGALQIVCFYGVLSVDMAGCQARSCPKGATASMTLSGTTKSVALTAEVKSGLTGLVPCSTVNAAFSGNIVVTCALGAVGSYSTTNCVRQCPTTMQVQAELGGSTAMVSPTTALASGATEYGRPCSEVNVGFEGTAALSCMNGELSYIAGECKERGCDSSTLPVSITVEGVTQAIGVTERIASGASADTLCEYVNRQTTGLVVLTCTRGVLSLSSKSCALSPCEPWDYAIATLHGVSGTVTPTTQLVGGASGVGQCGDINVEYSGYVQIYCDQGQPKVTNTTACQRTCATTDPGLDITIEATKYKLSPTQRIASGATRIEDCSAAAFGYSGDVTLRCQDGVLTLVSSVCTPNPCGPGTTVQAIVNGVSGVSSLDAQIANDATGGSSCEAVNPDYSGDLQVRCHAARLTLVSTTGCKRSCLATSHVDVTLFGKVFKVVPMPRILHGTESEQDCPFGFNGTMFLGCSDGTPSLVNHTCVPRPCVNPAGGADIPHGTTWTTACSALHASLSGTVARECYASVILGDVSSCQLPCGSTPASTANAPCATLDPSLPATISFACSAGTTAIDKSMCKHSCLQGAVAPVVTVGGTLSAQLTATIQHGTTETQTCDALGDYDGDIVLSCNDGSLSANDTCGRRCPADLFLQLTLAGSVYHLGLDSDLGNMENVSFVCSDFNPDAGGEAVVVCNDGVLEFDGACDDPCQDTLSVEVLLADVKHELSPTAQMLSEATQAQDCADLVAGYSGSVVLKCLSGKLSVQSAGCYPASCGTSATTTLELHNKSFATHPTAEVLHGNFYREQCVNVNNLYSGPVEVSCLYGKLYGDMTQCNLRCPSGRSVQVESGEGQVKTVATTSWMDHGADSTISCTTFDSHSGGTFTVHCEHGNVALNGSSCNMLPCPSAAQVELVSGGTGYLNPPQGGAQSGASWTATCASVNNAYAGTITASCYGGSVTADTSGCSKTMAGETMQITVVKSAMSFSIAGAASESAAAVQEAMQEEGPKSAVAKSIADGLGVDASRVTITSITVEAGARRLQAAEGAEARLPAGDAERSLAGGSLVMIVLFEVSVDSAASDTATLSSKITNLADSTSTENGAFSTALLTNLATAAGSSGSSALQSAVSAMNMNGITVLSVDEPTIYVVTISLTQPPSEKEEENRGGIIAAIVLGIIGGCLAFLCCFFGLRHYIRRRRSTSVRKLEEDDDSEGEAVAAHLNNQQGAQGDRSMAGDGSNRVEVTVVGLGCRPVVSHM